MPKSASTPGTTRPLSDTADSQIISLPYGWEKRFVARPKGKNKNRVDVYLRPPNGKQLRSKTELREYLKKHPNVQYDVLIPALHNLDRFPISKALLPRLLQFLF